MDEYRNNSEKYFTKKVGEVITCGNSMFMIWVFDGIRYREVYTVPDFMKKNWEFWREQNLMKILRLNKIKCYN